ncbi:MAG: DUF1080 domain-containing protein [Phycisphaerales bacterium]|nr:DUF1080 domain-containing protein [Phycisphaerales bacterium]
MSTIPWTRSLACSALAVLTAVSAAIADDAPPNTLTPAERTAGWTLLFDGTTSNGWRGYKKDAFPTTGWTIEDGCLRIGKGGGDIITVGQYGDFDFTFEWKATPAANSGVIYRVTEIHDAPWMTGPEYQVLDDGGYGAAADEPHSAGALYDLAAPAEGKKLNPAGAWNQGRIRLENGRLRHWLNGMKIVDVRVDDQTWTDRIDWSKFKAYPGFGVQPKGHLALQDHGDEVCYRNLKVRDLSKPMPGERALFDGKDLTGWTAVLPNGGKMEDVWSVRDGILVCTGNPVGYIRTNDDFTNYVLKLQWRFNPVTGKAGNSGVLLRKIGPDKVWPKSVEAQLHSGNAGDFWNIDEFQMTTDTERTNGRNTRKTHFAENPIGQWNDYEIIVDGGDVVLLVNGEEVNRATNVQEIPGKICLQSEGAEIQFRNVRLAEVK